MTKPFDGALEAFRAVHEAVGAMANWPDPDDETGLRFAGMVLDDALSVLHRRPKATAAGTNAYCQILLFVAARECGLSRAALWAKVAARIAEIDAADEGR